MVIECSRCGAPLEVAEDAQTTRCVYCGASQRVRSKKRRETKTFDSAPPRRSAGIGSGLLFMALFLFLPAFLWWRISDVDVSTTSFAPLRSLAAEAGLTHVVWDGSAPFQCDGNESLTINGVTAHLPDRTAVTVNGNCDVRLVNVQITAYEGIRADGNGTVTLENSRIDAAQVGVWADGNKHLEILGSHIVAGGTALRAGGNVSTVLTRGHVEGSARALELTANANADVRGTVLIGEIEQMRRDSVTGLETAKRPAAAVVAEPAVAPAVEAPSANARTNTGTQTTRRRGSRNLPPLPKKPKL